MAINPSNGRDSYNAATKHLNKYYQWQMSRPQARILARRAASLTTGGIIGVAIGGATLLFIVLTVFAIVLVKRKHKHGKVRLSEVEGGHVDMKQVPRRGFSTTGSRHAKRASFNPFMPLDDDEPSDDWAGVEGARISPRLTPRRLSGTKPLFGISGMRDSWPLVTNIPMSLMPGQSSTDHIVLSNVAAPGYEIYEDPKWPNRSTSKGSRSQRSSRHTISVPRELSDALPLSNESQNGKCSPRRPRPHLRSTSETHLSTILRSTSQRLKASKNEALRRTLTTLNRHPGSPPIERLATPTRLNVKTHTESREELVDSEPEQDESVASSVYDLLRSPSPRRQSPRKSMQSYPRPNKSPTPSAQSDDSLCLSGKPDLMIPGPLTSPSKNEARPQDRYRMRISSTGSEDISSMIYRDGGVSDAEENKSKIYRSLSLSAQHRHSLDTDPFYAQVKSAKPLSQCKLQGPRPLCIRKATFGQDFTSDRPQSTASPLQNISGNAQALPKSPAPTSRSDSLVSSDPERNPFQWEPQDLSHSRSNQTSPSRRRGHKRSRVVRISQLPRPSSVAIVPEESEDDSPLQSRQPFDAPLKSYGSIKSPSSARSSKDYRRISTRPPSSATFNPNLSVYDLTGRSGDNSPTLGVEEIINMYSPPLSTNYYTEHDGASEEDFFAAASTQQEERKSSRKAPLSSVPHHSRTNSSETFLFPSCAPAGKLVSFPPPSPILQERVITPSDLPRPLPSPTIPGSSVPALIQLPPTAPTLSPLLTIPTPAHLVGPRDQPTRRSGTLSPPCIPPMQATIGLLRRMNSEVMAVSHFSSTSTTPQHSPSSPIPGSESLANFSALRESSPSPVEMVSIAMGDEETERGRSRGSKNYLSLGHDPTVQLFPQPPSSSSVRSTPPPRRGTDKRNSQNVYEERRKRRNEEMEIELTSSRRGLVFAELTPVKEVSSPAAGPSTGRKANTVQQVSGLGLRFPKLNFDVDDMVVSFEDPSNPPVLPPRHPQRTSGLCTGVLLNGQKNALSNSNRSSSSSSAMGTGRVSKFNISVSELSSPYQSTLTSSSCPSLPGTKSPCNIVPTATNPVLTTTTTNIKNAAALTPSYPHPPPLFNSPSRSKKPSPSLIPLPTFGNKAHHQILSPIPGPSPRWSDAMPKPVVKATRRESRIESPTPKAPPNWTWGIGLGLIGTFGSTVKRDPQQSTILAEGVQGPVLNDRDVIAGTGAGNRSPFGVIGGEREALKDFGKKRKIESEKEAKDTKDINNLRARELMRMEGNENQGVRPESLYDQDGFLRCSPLHV